MKRKITLALLCLSAVWTLCHAQEFNRLGVADGLKQVGVTSIYQDVLGRMWFGSLEGVSVYDGNNVTTYKPYASNHLDGKTTSFLIGNDVPLISGDSKGNVFLVADHSLIRYNCKTEVFTRLEPSDVQAMVVYKDMLWCMMKGNVYSYDDKNQKFNCFVRTGIKDAICMLKTATGLWIGTWSGLYLVEGRSVRKLSNDCTCGLFEDSRGQVWVGTRYNGVFIFGRGMHVEHLPYRPGSTTGMSSQFVRAFQEDQEGNIWIGTFNGLQKYNPYTGLYDFYTPQPYQGSLSHSSVYAVYKDFQGTMWVGTYYGGVNYFSPQTGIIDHYYRMPLMQHVFVGDMTEDASGHLWICLDGGGLNCMDLKTKQVTHYEAGNGNALPHNNLKTICYDRQHNRLFIGTHLGGLCCFDLNNHTFHNYIHEGTTGNMPSDVINKVLIWQNELIVASTDGFHAMDLNTGRFTKLQNEVYRFVDIDGNGIVWAADDQNLYEIDMRNPRNRRRVPIHFQFNIDKVFAANDGNVYIGTLGAGLYCYNTRSRRVRQFTAERRQLVSNYCYNMQESAEGGIWVTSDKGMTYLSVNHRTTDNMRLNSSLFKSLMASGCGLHSASDGQLYVGTTNGIFSFNGGKLMPIFKAVRPSLYFSRLSVNNQEIYAGDDTGILDEALPYLKKLVLKYNQNNFSVSFAQSNYIDLLANRNFEYKLEGFDEDWIRTNQMTVSYTNIAPGHYVLKIREADIDLQGARGTVLSIPIVIHPVWFATWWFRLLMVIIIAVGVAQWMRIRRGRLRLRQLLDEERTEKRHQDQVTKDKLRFFTNISHEFRTPLTLILGQIDLMLQNTNLAPGVYNQILKLSKHCQQLKLLISELLDFRRMEQNGLELQVAEMNAVTFSKEILLSFKEYARHRRINLSFVAEEEEMLCWFDARQMEKVLYNLLSNAFKYTPDGGDITLKLEADEKLIRFSVRDNGTGIAEKDRKRIFERFYQGQNEGNEVNVGTGIGLSLVWEIVTLHGGTISVQSEEGKGSEFIVTLTRDKEHFDASKVEFLTHKEQSETAIKSLPDNSFLSEAIENMNSDPTGSQKDLKILLVEDNAEVM